MENKEINLKELLFFILKKWRAIIIFALVCALISGSYSLYKSKKNIEAGETAGLSKDLSYLGIEEKEKVNEVIKLYETLRKKENYLSESEIMKIDPYNVNTVILQYYVAPTFNLDSQQDNVKDYSQSLLMSYVNYIKYGLIWENIEQKNDFNIQKNYLKEIISVEINDTNPSENNSGYMFVVQIVNSDAEKCLEIANLVQEEIEDYKEKINEMIYNHDLVLINKNQTTKIELSLASNINNIENQILVLNNEITSDLNMMSEAQVKAVNEYLQRTEDDVQNQPQVPVISKRYIIVGLGMGIVIIGIFYTLQFVLSAFVKEERDFDRYFNIRILGVIVEEQKKKKLFSSIDDFIERKKSSYSKIINYEDNISLCIIKLLFICQSNDISQLIITGTSLKNISEDILNKIKDKLKQNNIDICMYDNLGDVGQIENILKHRNVLLIEKMGEVKYVDIEQELTLFEECQINVRGIIVVK